MSRTAKGTAAAQPTSPLQTSIEVPGALRWTAAATIDAIVAGGAAVGAATAALGARGVRVAVQPLVDYLHADTISALATLLVPAFLALFAYQLITVIALGATVGQRALGLRVLRGHNGAKPGILRVVVRALGSATGVLALGAGPFWALWLDRRRRGLGDIVARTVVARPPPAASGGSP